MERLPAEELDRYIALNAPRYWVEQAETKVEAGESEDYYIGIINTCAWLLPVVDIERSAILSAVAKVAAMRLKDAWPAEIG